MLLQIIPFAFIGSIGAIFGAALLLLFPQGVRQYLLPLLLSYAVGTLLGGAFLCLIPEGLEQAPATPFMATVLTGIVAFFALERLLLQRHSLAHEAEATTFAGPLILIGDAFHNFVDGIVIAAAFMTSPALGMTVTLAVVAHEVPQEVGEFAILLENGFSRGKAFLLNSLSATATLPGAILGYFWLAEASNVIPYMLAVSAASFIYIASVDLIPSLHRKMNRGSSLQQISFLIAGMVSIGVVGASG